jgi:GntR family transcriptional repressor for pyruvate dehydrogenase complex
MSDSFAPVERQRLSDSLANRLSGLIRTGALEAGERLPAITAMARSFRVAPPTLREALAKLEAVGLVEVRQGLGVFVCQRATYSLAFHSTRRPRRTALSAITSSVTDPTG